MGGQVVRRTPDAGLDGRAEMQGVRRLRAGDPSDLIVRREIDLRDASLEAPISAPSRAVIADVHALTRHGMRALIAQCEDVEIVAEASSGPDAVRATVEQGADLALVDLDLPELDGIQVTKRIRAQVPSARVIVLGADGTHELALRALRAGASGYLSKSAEVEQFKAAIATAKAGGVYLDAAAAGTLVFSIDRGAGKKGERAARGGELTEREVEVARLMAEGQTARRIASRLGISDRTVNSHMTNLYRRLGVNNRVDAVRELMRLGITPAPR